jgi:dipeptidyl aminopeptidase/acylaminoacyl peptidase
MFGRPSVTAVAVVLVLSGMTFGHSGPASAGSAPGSGSPSQEEFTLEQVFGAPYPDHLVSARDTDRIAWTEYREGPRNVWTAAAPDFQPVQLTRFTEDDGWEMPEIQITGDGSIVVFVRGGYANREGIHPNPLSEPAGREQVMWAISTRGGEPWRLARGSEPALSPDGQWVAFVRDGQIWEVPVHPQWSDDLAGSREEGNVPRQMFGAAGMNGSPTWSPDSRRLAFVSDRGDHSFVGIFDREARKISWMAAGVDRDRGPTWSPDGSKVAFFRTPGAGFSDDSTFQGGHRVTIWIADVASGAGYEMWNPPAGPAWYVNLSSLRWTANERLLFVAENDNWSHVYSISTQGGEAVDLMPWNGIVEHVGVSSDGQWLFYDSNLGDIDRRHLWKVPTGGGEPVSLTGGDGIETTPAPLSSGDNVALFSATATQPQSVAVVSAEGGSPRVVAPQLPFDFPNYDLVVPAQVILESDDGLEIHCQLFLPVGAQAGDGRAAVLFMHGGPRRQMLLGWHYKQYYTNTYAFHQYLANRGFVVLSVNFRGGIGYGRSFRMAPGTGRRGASEYADVLLAGRYLRDRPEVDPDRVGAWGGSWGGYLAAMALARNSDIFAAGVDLNGVHAWSPSDPSSLAFRSSPAHFIETWQSPVFLSHGDDDRNVPFSQTVGLAQALRAKGVHVELQIFPDEVHEYLLHEHLLAFYGAAADFFERFLRGDASARGG